MTAGYQLLKNHKNYEVIVLEECSCVGGISRTVEHNGNRMDIGGHRFFTKDPEVLSMWDELMPMQGHPSYDDRVLNRGIGLHPGGPDPEKEDTVMLSRRRISRIFYKKTFFDYPVRMNIETIKSMGFFTTISAGLSYLRSIIHKYPEDSLEKFYINRFGKKLYSMFFESYTEKLWGRHPREISADWGAQRVKGLSIFAVLKDIFSKFCPFLKRRKVETSLIEEFRYPKFGPGHYWELVASEIENLGGTVVKNCKAEKLITKDNVIKKVKCLQNGNEVEFECDLVISSMPLSDLINSLDQVPSDEQRIAKGLPYRDFVTVGLLVDKLQLKNKTKLKTLNHIIPDCWIYVQDSGVKLGRIQIFNNWSPYMVKTPDSSVWIGLEYFCKEGDPFWALSSEEWCKMGVKELIAMGVIAENETIHDFHVEKVKKAYPAYFDTYHEIGKLISYLDTLNNLYCIGRNGQHRYNNMDHSMATAFEAVRNIVSGNFEDKSAIWNVNTEKEYHEEKKC